MTERAEPDLWLGGRLRLRQPPRGAHRAGTDAALLTGLFRPDPGTVICDLGASTGAIGLGYASLHQSCTVLLVEKDEELAALARENARANGLAERVSIFVADVLAPAARRREAGLQPECADILVTNPPFFDDGRHRPSPNVAKASAHSFSGGGLDDWMRACTDLLRPRGKLGMIHRADALPDCLDVMRHRFGGVTIRPVQAAAGQPAIRVLIRAEKGSRAPFSLLAPLVLHDASGRFTAEAEAWHRGEAPSQ